MASQLAALRPRYCIPFASFSVFANEENAYLNDERNSGEQAVKGWRTMGLRP
jgi:hypothetical protein